MSADPAAPVTLRLLGSFEAYVHGAPLRRLRAQPGYWLLGLLALRAGAAVDRAWLAGTLWAESPHATAAENLRTYLKDLRRALGPQAGRLRSVTAHTLCLDLAGADVDVTAFDQAIARGDLASLQEAVGLYRGPLLEGCGEEWAFRERQAREQAYLAARERLAAFAFEQGKTTEAERHLRLAVAVDPLRESAQRALMQALAAGGNYAAAVHCYRELRLLLHRELNTEPDAETQTLFQQLRSEGRRLAAKGSGEGLGGRAVWVQHPAAVDALRHHLPRQLTRFIGREREMAEVRRLLADRHLLTLTGSGGCGKTRLALQLAAERVEEYPDGVWWVELAALADPRLVPQTVASTLGLREEPGRPPTQTLLAYLRAKHLLLVLDNCEHLIAGTPPRELGVGGCAQLADTLLRACPGLRILATSRAGLGVSGEQTYRVPSLSLPPIVDGRGLIVDGLDKGKPDPAGTIDHQLSTISQSEAVQLFADRARLSEVTFAVTPANALAVAHVCQCLEGIPLAIELAAARVKALPVEQIAERLDDLFGLLTGGIRTALPRQQTLRASIDWSYHLLSEAERTLLRRLSVFAGGWTLAAAEAVGAGDGIERGEVLDLLSQLVENSLALHQPVDGEARYRLLETVRQYARERLSERGEEEAVCERHGAFCLQLAEAAHAAARAGSGAEAFERLEPEHDNLRAALAWAAPRDEGYTRFAGTRMRDEEMKTPSHPSSRIPHPSALALRLAGALGEFWFDRGYWNEGREWLERALAVAPGAEPTVERARALAAAGRITIYLSTYRPADYSAAQSWLEESVALYRRLADTRGLVEALSCLAELLRFGARNLAVARKVEEEAVALARSLGDPRLLSMALCKLNLAIRDDRAGDDRVAWMHLEESLALARQVGDRRLMIDSLLGLGQISQRQGDLAKARELLEESLQLARAAKTKRGLARALFFLAEVLARQGDTERAKPLWEESLRLAGELRIFIAGCALASLAVQAPFWEGALQMVAQAAAEYGPEVVRLALEALVVRAPSYEEALRRIDRAARECGPEATIHPLGALGHAAQERGDYEGAATCYRRSLVLRQEAGDTTAIAQSLEDFAGLAARQEQWERAAALLGAAEGVCVAMGWTPPVSIAGEYERAVQGTRGALGEERFAAAWAAGRALSLPEAVAYALAAEGF